MNVRILTIMFAASVAACSGDHPNVALMCRDVASKIETAGPGITDSYPYALVPAEVDCTFDSTLLQYSCRSTIVNANGTTATQMKVWHYASVYDFVEEGRTVGAVRAIGYSFQSDSVLGIRGPELQIPDRLIEGTNTFDDSGRLIRTIPQDEPWPIDYVAWDAAGRPTQAAFVRICATDAGVRHEYNDNARRVTSRVDTITQVQGLQPVESRQCMRIERTLVFDEAGNVTAWLLDGQVRVTYEVKATQQVCAPSSSGS